ncbi:MAG: aldolase/citrate lyase family protein [Vicinamibacterales bacterium]|nr:aldolase/citrate lyase family protein [Vicinamibacterales bacterium]
MKRIVLSLLLGVACVTGVTGSLSRVLTAQQRQRLNPMITALANGGVALSGRDWQFIDLEHNPLDLTKLDQTIAELTKNRRPDGTVDLKLAPLVRIPMDGDEGFKWAVKQILEIGVMGVVFPRVETKAQAELAVRTHRFKPQKGGRFPNPPGLRHVTPSKAARRWGLTIDDYIDKYADVWPLNPDGELFTMIMIESAEGMNNINEILDVPGIGAIFVGPNDFSMSLGNGRWAPKHPEDTERGFQRILLACKAKKVICGMQVDGGPPAIEERIKQGWRVILGGGA